MIKNEFMRERREKDPWSRRRDQISVIRCRAKKKGLEFNLKWEDLEWPTHCPLLEIELNYSSNTNGPDSPSIDRKDSTKGYTKENCRVISNKANTMKSNSTIEEILLLAKNIKDYY